MAGVALSVVSSLIDVTREMYRKISELRLVNTTQKDLLRRINEIKVELTKVHEDEDIAANLRVMEIISESTSQSLQECNDTCTKIADQMGPMKLLHSGFNKATLDNLQKRLGEIHQNLMSAVTFATHQKLVHMERSIIAMGSQAGAYPITNNVSPPTAVDKPECSIINDEQIKVSWNKSSSSVQYYEIEWNGKKIDDKFFNNSYIIESPTFNRKPGIYAFRVRAINAGGPGEWSDIAILEYKTAPPNKPGKPEIMPPGPDNVQVVVDIPGIDESNGAAVNKIIIKYNLKSAPNDWHDEIFIVNDTLGETLPCTKKFKISGLEPYTCYSFRIILVNDCGESTPSEPVCVYTIKIPGKPANFKICCYYNHISIVWDPPAENARFVENYVLYCKEKSEGKDRYKLICETKNLCATVNGLQPGTEYDLLVIAVNKNGHCSDWASILVKTKPESMEETIKRLCDKFGWYRSFQMKKT